MCQSRQGCNMANFKEILRACSVIFIIMVIFKVAIIIKILSIIIFVILFIVIVNLSWLIIVSSAEDSNETPESHLLMVQRLLFETASIGVHVNIYNINKNNNKITLAVMKMRMFKSKAPHNALHVTGGDLFAIEPGYR
ncbi:hypothetical protein HELRODRAFT_168623 [Helobdella robusta]|uniref:Uncharacterized protein n=1 Tax=Helobdella robusta TaxID=6412 RepID=T1F0S9_HELRO|nr:hypothetical protein HELRODRAFT_168623 [Helobdella robusta]ESO09611.1 hypothetical protein HELRODRAFT_168623 [Helobdella robusta]